MCLWPVVLGLASAARYPRVREWLVPAHLAVQHWIGLRFVPPPQAHQLLVRHPGPSAIGFFYGGAGALHGTACSVFTATAQSMRPCWRGEYAGDPWLGTGHASRVPSVILPAMALPGELLLPLLLCCCCCCGRGGGLRG